MGLSFQQNPFSQNLRLTVVGIIVRIPLGMLVLDYLIEALASGYEMNMEVGTRIS